MKTRNVLVPMLLGLAACGGNPIPPVTPAEIKAGLAALDQSCILASRIAGVRNPPDVAAGCGILEAAYPLLVQELDMIEAALAAAKQSTAPAAAPSASTPAAK
jgi:hypothetical protein